MRKTASEIMFKVRSDISMSRSFTVDQRDELERIIEKVVEALIETFPQKDEYQ